MVHIILICFYVFLRFILMFCGDPAGEYFQEVDAFYAWLDVLFALYTIGLSSWWMFREFRAENPGFKVFIGKHFYSVFFTAFSAFLILTSLTNPDAALEFSGFLPVLGDCFDRYYPLEKMFHRTALP